MKAPRPWLLALASVTLVTAVYLPALSGPFVWDDRALVFEDPAVEHVHSPQRYLFSPFWAAGPELRAAREFYRPLTTFAFAVDRAVHGANASGYHVTNVAVHLVACVLLFALLRRSSSAMLASVLSALWAVLPRLAESVAWIAGRTDVLAATFGFAALLAWRSDSPQRRWTSAALLLLGLFAKEVAIAVWFALMVECFVERRLRRSLPLVAVVITYVALRTAALHGAPPSAYPHFGALGRAALVLEAMGRYAFMLLDVWQPRTQIGLTEGGRNVPFTVAGACIAAVLLVALLSPRWRGRIAGTLGDDPHVRIGWTTFLVSIGLVLHVVPLPINVVAADRFLYLPTAALALAIAPVVQAWSARFRSWPPIVAVAAATLAVDTYRRAGDWSDEARLWVKAVRTAPPKDALPHNQLGNVYFRVGRYEEALAEYRHSLANDRMIDDAPARSRTERGNIANCLSKLGRYSEAVRVRDELASQMPEVPRLHLDLAGDLLRLLDFAGARVEVENSLRLFPAYDEAKEALTRIDELERDTPEVFSAAPATHALTVRRARTFVALGRRPDALVAWSAVLADGTSTADEVFEGAVYLSREAMPDAAKTALGHALTVVHDERATTLATGVEARLVAIAQLDAALADP